MNRNIEKIMLTMRQFRADMLSATKKHNAELQKLESYRGSQHYEEKSASLAAALKVSLRDVRAKYTAICEECFAAATDVLNARMSVAPTAEMMHTLAVLDTMSNVTFRQANGAAKIMRGCPLAMEKLRAILAKQNIIVPFDDPEVDFERLENFRSAVQFYFEAFNPENPEFMSASAKMLDAVLIPEAGVAQDRVYLETAFGITEPGRYDPNYTSESLGVQFKFKDTLELSNYLNSKTEGMSEDAKNATVEFVLRNSPECYGAHYRRFIATGYNTSFGRSAEI